MKINNNYIILILSSVIIFGVSCKKFVEINPPKNQVTNSAVFSDSANASAAVMGIYINMMQNFGFAFASGGITAYSGLSSDEIYNTSNNTDENDFYSNSISINNSLNGYLWTNAYNLLYHANDCIEGLAVITNISSSAKNQLIGEAKFVRAFILFNLVNLYGAVPLITSTDYHLNQVAPRSSLEAVYAQIISDLTVAQNLLPTTYAGSGRLRPNSYTAIALLSKVYLYQKQWVLAENAATQIINSGTYSLEPNLNNIFLATSAEAIWKLSPVLAGYETWEGYNFIPSSTSVLPRYVVTNSLLNAFEVGDQRKTNWLKSNTVGSQVYNYPYKYKLGYDGLSTPKENYVIFRLAEQYLIRAEARAQQGNISGAAADLNIVRNRALLPNTIAADQVSILTAIQHERQIELFCEWGNRWFDLKRTNKADAVLGPIKTPNWQSTDMLYPIPQNEINNNPFLTQNPGY